MASVGLTLIILLFGVIDTLLCSISVATSKWQQDDDGHQGLWQLCEYDNGDKLCHDMGIQDIEGKLNNWNINIFL